MNPLDPKRRMLQALAQEAKGWRADALKAKYAPAAPEAPAPVEASLESVAVATPVDDAPRNETKSYDDLRKLNPESMQSLLAGLKG